MSRSFAGGKSASGLSVAGELQDYSTGATLDIQPYFWTEIRKFGVYTKPPPGTSKELLIEKIRNYIHNSDEIALRTFISSILELETIRQGINKANAR